VFYPGQRDNPRHCWSATLFLSATEWPGVTDKKSLEASSLLGCRAVVYSSCSLAATAHGDQNEIRGVYNNASYLDQCREMTQAWADSIDALCIGNNVIHLKRKNSS
jgi:hypothetical protein